MYFLDPSGRILQLLLLYIHYLPAEAKEPDKELSRRIPENMRFGICYTKVRVEHALSRSSLEPVPRLPIGGRALQQWLEDFSRSLVLFLIVHVPSPGSTKELELIDTGYGGVRPARLVEEISKGHLARCIRHDLSLIHI